MISVHIRGMNAAIDEIRTRTAYESLASSLPYKCVCAHCANFRAIGSSAFPKDVLEFFSRAGIDPMQPAETYELGAFGEGKHLYGGEYYFFGDAPLSDRPTLDPSGKFDFAFTAPSPLAQAEFSKPDAVCFSFLVALPWVISEPP